MSNIDPTTESVCRAVGGKLSRNQRQFGVMTGVDVCTVDNKGFAIGKPAEMAEGHEDIDFEDNVIMVDDGKERHHHVVDYAQEVTHGMEEGYVMVSGPGGRTDITKR